MPLVPKPTNGKLALLDCEATFNLKSAVSLINVKYGCTSKIIQGWWNQLVAPTVARPICFSIIIVLVYQCKRKKKRKKKNLTSVQLSH